MRTHDAPMGSSKPTIGAADGVNGTFTLSGGPPVFAELVASHLRKVHPCGQVDLAAGSAPAEAGVAVTYSPTGTWIFLSARDAVDDRVLGALAEGAAAVALLTSTSEELRRVVSSLTTGVEYVPRDIARWLARNAVKTAAPAVEPSKQGILTAREQEVLELVADGLSNGEIAEKLVISVNTVRTHLRSLSMKLEAGNRTRMLGKAREMGLIGHDRRRGQRPGGEE